MMRSIRIAAGLAVLLALAFGLSACDLATSAVLQATGQALVQVW